MSNRMLLSVLSSIVVGRIPRRVFVAALIMGLPGLGWAGTYSFFNTNSIPINDLGTPPTMAALYPSSITVDGLTGQTINHLSVTLYGFSHTFPSDVDIVLGGPSGELSMLMGEVGGSTKLPVSNLTLILDDSAANSLPLNSMLTSGTFKPTRGSATLSFEFPTPAPAGSSSALAALSVFNGTDPNGNWNLFVVDESSPDAGTISLGWSMQVTTVPEPGPFGFAAVALSCISIIRMWRR